MSVGAVNKQTGDRIPTAGMPAVDSVLSGSSTNPVQNRVVKAALDDKADTDIVASDFSAAASYTAGNYCIYEGKFYKFKNNHSGAWSAADVDEIKIAGELSSLKSGLTNLNEKSIFNATQIDSDSVEVIVPYYSCGFFALNINGVGDFLGYFRVNAGTTTVNYFIEATSGGLTVSDRASGKITFSATQTGNTIRSISVMTN